MSMHTRTHSPWVDMYYRRPKQLRPLVQKFLGQCDDVVGKGVASTGEVCLDGRESNSIFDAVRKNLQQRDRELLKTRDRVRSWLTALPHQGFERVRSDGSRSGNDAHEVALRMLVMHAVSCLYYVLPFTLHPPPAESHVANRLYIVLVGKGKHADVLSFCCLLSARVVRGVV